MNADVVCRFGEDLLLAYGATAEHASVVIRQLVESSLAGLHSHGVMRLSQYINEILSGEIDPAAIPQIAEKRCAQITIDGKRCFGQIAGMLAVEVASDAALEFGVSLVTVRSAGHAGRIGAYTEAIARRGHFCIAFCSGPPASHRVAPFGAREARLATNPISYAFPTVGEPLVADFSTSATTEGHIRFLRNRDLQAPVGTLRDAHGNPTTDPNALYAQPPGTLQPLGSPEYGHKGTALGLLVEAMATLVAGDRVTDKTRRGNNLAFISVHVGQPFQDRADELIAYVRSARPVDSRIPVLLPGDRRRQIQASTTEVVFDLPTWQQIEQVATMRKVTLPRTVPRNVSGGGRP